LVVTALFANVAAVMLVLAAADIASLTVLVYVNASMQLFLANWVRARGLAVYQLTFMGGQAVAAPGRLLADSGPPARAGTDGWSCARDRLLRSFGRERDGVRPRDGSGWTVSKTDGSNRLGSLPRRRKSADVRGRYS